MSTQPDTNDIITNDVTTNDSSTSNKNNTLSRRDFLKYSAGAVGAASLSGVTIVSWRWMIQDQHGTINVILGWFHLGPIFFLSDTKWAVVSVIVIKIWRSFPFMMISLIAALQTIDASLYEAARIDGAGRWAAFRSVTFPGIRNISIILWILMTIWSVNDFETPFLLTQGGPSNATENLMILAYKDTFARNTVGSGAAVAFISLIILMILAIVMMRLRNRN